MLRSYLEEHFETAVIKANNFDKVNFDEIINEFGGKECCFLKIYKSAYIYDENAEKLHDLRAFANYAYRFLNAIHKYETEKNHIKKKYIPIAVSSLNLLLKYPLLCTTDFVITNEICHAMNLLKILIKDEIPTPFEKDLWTYNFFAFNLEFAYVNDIADSLVKTGLKEKILKVFPEDKEKSQSIQLLLEFKYENN